MLSKCDPDMYTAPTLYMHAILKAQKLSVLAYVVQM